MNKISNLLTGVSSVSIAVLAIANGAVAQDIGEGCGLGDNDGTVALFRQSDNSVELYTKVSFKLSDHGMAKVADGSVKFKFTNDHEVVVELESQERTERPIKRTYTFSSYDDPTALRRVSYTNVDARGTSARIEGENQIFQVDMMLRGEKVDVMVRDITHPESD